MSTLSYNDEFVFNITNSGIQVYDRQVGGYLSMLTFSGTTLWCNSTNLYVGTTSGIYYTNSDYPLTNIFNLYKAYPDITDNYIICLHGAADYLSSASISGVDQYNLTNTNRIHTIVSGVTQCVQTTDGSLYYSLPDRLEALYDNYSNWTIDDLDYSYISGAKDGFIDSGITINNFCITENTSIYSNGNNIFLATSSGIIQIEERRGEEAANRVKYYYIGV